MADHVSAKKRIRRNARREEVNSARRNRIRTFIKRVEKAIGDGNKNEAAEAYRVAQPEVHRGVSRGVLHKNTAARKLSRLSGRINALK
jgi:small subunit ribosomal protein S20